MSDYATIGSKYKGFEHIEWQTHDLTGDCWHPHFDLDVEGRLHIEQRYANMQHEFDTLTDTIDVIGIVSGKAEEYRLTFADGRLTLIEDLLDRQYWDQKWLAEYRSWPFIKRVHYQIDSLFKHLRLRYRLRFKRRQIREAFVAPIKRPIQYQTIGRRLIQVEPSALDPVLEAASVDVYNASPEVLQSMCASVKYLDKQNEHNE